MVFGTDFLWFLPALPAYCPIYWWDDVPYYYYDSVYYTWDAADNGYVVTEPPPAAAAYSSDDSTGDASPAASAPDTHTGPIDSGNLYAYPKNGQSQQQQAQDRQECERWAVSQTGSSADHPGSPPDTAVANNSIDYRRALSACLTGRGYSVD